jgi:hypothetical protein
MSLLGTVFNKAAGKYINVYLATSGSFGFRPTDAIGSAVKDAALAKLRAAFEDGKLFNDEDMKRMDRINITYVPSDVSGRPNC